MGTVTDSKNRPFNLHGSTFDNEGDKWTVTFSYIPRKTGHSVKVTAKCNTKRAPILNARNNCNQILNLWPFEYWPEFAKPLANRVASGNDGSIQEGLF